MTRACVAAVITASMFVGAPAMRGSISAQQAACLHGSSYAVSVKDTLDPCAFAYFSDETGVIYTGQALQ